MSVLTKKLFWFDAVERSIKTVAQSMVALLTASGVLGILEVDWEVMLSISALSGLVSILTSIASSGTGNSASLVVDNVKNKEQ